MYTWKNWMILHWIINPGLAFNELILGQRIPKISLEDKTSDKSRVERSYVPCPHCNMLHDGRTWSTQNGTAYRNWFGLYCSNCEGVIPCLTNGLSFVILIVTYPIWGWFRKSLKSKWMSKQSKRYENIDLANIPNPYDRSTWLYSGLTWGGFMFIMMSLIFPFLMGEEISTNSLLFGALIWTIAGLIFGYTLNWYLRRKGDGISTKDQLNCRM